MTMAALPRIAVILTGGTIDSVGKIAWILPGTWKPANGLTKENCSAGFRSSRTLRMCDELPFPPPAESRPRRQGLARSPAHDRCDFDADQADGIVITHGTNTIEETAYFLNLTLKSDKPVVIVGSMRPSSAISADGYLNVINAVKVAADPAFRGRGCLRGHERHDIQWARRDQELDLSGGSLSIARPWTAGFADADGKVIYYHHPSRRHTVDTEFDVRGLMRCRVSTSCCPMWAPTAP